VVDVVLVVLRRPELAESLLHAGERMAKLMDGARLNVLARSPTSCGLPTCSGAASWSQSARLASY